MRRLIIMRKDLHLSPGKLVAMCMHCAEAYWTNILKNDYKFHNENGNPVFKPTDANVISFQIALKQDVWNEYVNGIFTKTVCEAKNLNDLRKIDRRIEEVNASLPEDERLVQKVDYGFINDKCLTELTPENPDGTTTVGMWFRPLPDEISKVLSKKYHLYVSDTDKMKTSIVEAYKILSDAISVQDWTKAKAAADVLAVFAKG